jgi:hypothetical protein
MVPAGVPMVPDVRVDNRVRDYHVDVGDRANANQDVVIVLDRWNERYRWRCKLCQMFSRQYKGDAARVKAARGYAYANRKMIHEAFDRGGIKAVVLNALRVGFETPPVIHDTCGRGMGVGDRREPCSFRRCDLQRRGATDQGRCTLASHTQGAGSAGPQKDDLASGKGARPSQGTACQDPSVTARNGKTGRAP